MSSRATFTAGASSRSRSSTARALRTAAALKGSSSVIQISRVTPALLPAAVLCGPELPAAAIAHHPACGRVAEMTADDHDLRIPETLDERLAGERTLCLVHVEVPMTQRLGELNGMMHQVAGNHGGFSARLDEHADVARRMARRRKQRPLLGQPIIGRYV